MPWYFLCLTAILFAAFSAWAYPRVKRRENTVTVVTLWLAFGILTLAIFIISHFMGQMAEVRL